MSYPPAFDVVVVGGGHAGCEAALAAARLGAATALVTMTRDGIACMPCDPAIGGLAKSHLVFEIDAIGGEMARNADFTGIQFRQLNTSKGPAVRANRVQCDKDAYARRMRAVLQVTRTITIVEGVVAGLSLLKERLTGVRLADGTEIMASAVVITAGTSLAGRIHIGHRTWPGGRRDADASDALSENLRLAGLRMGRLKTGTPARLLARTIDYSRMEAQPGMLPPPFFSWEARQRRPLFHVEQSASVLIPWEPGTDQLPCHLTHTTRRTHELIRANLPRSALYGGQITGTGARYCPSVEDKVVKFPDRDSHHVFIEPEGRTTPLVYPNGISNSLPEDIQIDLIHSVPGLEHAEVVHWAYAIEYDFADPTELDSSLQSKRIGGLFMAGQVNGTTGYEEAAAQGLIAGVNAARFAAGRAPVVVSRDSAYIGVLIDDLVTKGTDEPYRMFTSRAERRLVLRQDNARFRLLPLARDIGLAAPEFIAETERFQTQVAAEVRRLATRKSEGATLAQVLCRPGSRYTDLPGSDPSLSTEVVEQIEITARYAGYIAREERAVEKALGLSRQKIPVRFDYNDVRSLKYEAREKLSRVRPANLGQALRIPGVTPADVAIIAVMLRRHPAPDIAEQTDSVT